MKRILISLLSLMLVCSTLFLCACGGTETPTPDNGGDTGTGGGTGSGGDTGTGGGTGTGGDTGSGGGTGTGGTDDVIDVYDPSNPMADPSNGVLSVLYSRSGLLAQPSETVFATTSLESAKMLRQLANAETIILRGRPEVPLYGLYAFTHEFSETQDDITRVGFTNIRTQRESDFNTELDHAVSRFNDDDMRKFCESNISIMFTVGQAMVNAKAPGRSTFYPQKYGVSYPGHTALYTDLDNYDFSTFLRRGIRYTLDILGKYGPRGSFFDENPEVNYNPIRYIEMYNEPNFQYLLPVTREGGSDDPYRGEKFQVYAIWQVACATAVRRVYGDEVQIVGMSAGGGADDSGVAFIEGCLALSGDDTLEKYLNDAMNPDALTQINKTVVSETTGEATIKETDAEFTKRKQYAAELRELIYGKDNTNVTPLELDLVGTMDIISIHPYIDGKSPFACNTASSSQSDAINKMRAALIANASEADKERAAVMPFWFTECGWQIKGKTAYAAAYPEDDANGIKGGMAAEYSDPNTGTSQILQAAMEVQDYLYGIRNGIDRITYMHLYDTDGCNYGLLNYGYTWGGDRTWRLTLYATQNMINILPDPALKRVVTEKITTIDNKAVGIYVYEIESAPGEEIVTTVLSPLTPQLGYKLDWDEDYAMVTDMFGKSQIVKAVNGQISVDAGPYILYVRHVDRATLEAYGLVNKVEIAPLTAMFGNAWNTNRDEDII